MIEIQNHCLNNKITILDEGRKLFQTKETPISREPLKEKIKVGSKGVSKTQQIRGYQLKEYGFTIGRETKSSSIKKLKIVPLQHPHAFAPQTSTLKETVVELDLPHSRARIIDDAIEPFGKSKWYNISSGKISRYITKPPDKNNTSYYNILKKENEDPIGLYVKEEEYSLEELPEDEIPVMISEDNKIVCIKLTRDAVHVGIIGKTGTGKTVLAHSILDRLYWRTSRKIAIMNDSVNQCFAWGFPQDEKMFLPSLKKTYAEARPLPIVNFAPNSNTLRELPLEGTQTFRLLLSWEWLVQNYKSFFQSKPEWKLDKTEKYLAALKDELEDCTSMEQVFAALQAADKANGGELPSASIQKLSSIFEDIFDAGFVDISTPHGSGRWTFNTMKESFEEHPFVGVMRTRGVPVFNTVDLKLKHYYPQYVKFMLDQIMRYQQSLELHNQEPIHLFFDEITDIYRIGRGRTIAGNKLVETITQGRNHNIGAIYTTQEYLGVEESIRANTGYFFCLLQGSDENRKRIMKDFNLPKNTATNLGELEKFECIVISNDREFVLYDADGNKEVVTGAIQGRILAPLSRHRPPGGGIEEREVQDDEEEPIETVM